MTTDDTKRTERFKLTRCIGGYRITPEHTDPARHPLVLELCGGSPHGLVRLRKGELTWVVGELMVEATRRGMLLEPRGRLKDPVLVLSRADAPAPAAGTRYPFQALHGRYAGQWGLGDLYDSHRQALEAALASGQCFDTREFGAKKEIHYGRVARSAPGGPLALAVRCEADDGVALADTAFWSVAGGNDVCSSGEDALQQLGLDEALAVHELEALAKAAGVDETNGARRASELPATASLEDVLAELEALAAAAEEELDARYERMQGLARSRLAALQPRRP
jgi:hypothetical protein